MKILALLPADARHTLEKSLAGVQHLTKGAGAEAAAVSLREKRFDALVIDPGMFDADEFEVVLRAANDSRVPMMLYTTLDREAAKSVMKAVQGSARELVLRGMEDSPELLQKKLAALVSPSAPAILLSQAASRFREFPDQLQTVTVSLFGRTTLPRWVDGLVKETGLARRTVDRWMHRGGISGAARLLDAVRLARVWEPLVDNARPLAEVAVQCGYARVRLLTSHTRRILGVEPPQLRHKFSRLAFATRLADALKD